MALPRKQLGPDQIAPLAQRGRADIVASMHLYGLICVVLLLASSTGRSMFVWTQTKQVPIERLFGTLEQRLVQNSNSFEVTYQLARLHSMAFATNQATFPADTNTLMPVFYSPGTDAGVPKQVNVPADPERRQKAFGHLTNAIVLYERALGLLKKSTNAASQKKWLILPTELGLAWCLDQAGRRNEALTAYRKTLKIAWKMEVTGDFDFKQWLEDRWREVRSGNLPIGNSRPGYIGPGVCFSEEIIGYMLKLLDPVKDATEIADLQNQRKTLQKMGRAVTPVLVPLNASASFATLVNSNAHVLFDLDGTGLAREWGWITPKAAWLVFDPDGAGTISSALQMFGNVTFWIFWRDGYAALAALDSDGDGVLRGSELQGLALWHDRNSNGISEPGEVRPVGDYGITAIGCTAEMDSNGMLWNPGGVFFCNGEIGPTYDWVSPSATENRINDRPASSRQ